MLVVILLPCFSSMLCGFALGVLFLKAVLSNQQAVCTYCSSVVVQQIHPRSTLVWGNRCSFDSNVTSFGKKCVCDISHSFYHAGNISQSSSEALMSDARKFSLCCTYSLFKFSLIQFSIVTLLPKWFVKFVAIMRQSYTF